MKANAPERLYLSKTIYSTYLYQVPDPDDETAVEYIRKDAFIEKACEWIEKRAARYLVDRFVYGMRITGIDTSITDDFRKDMED